MIFFWLHSFTWKTYDVIFKELSNTPLHKCIIFFIHSAVDRYQDYFQFSANINIAAIIMIEQVSLWYSKLFLEYMFMSGTAIEVDEFPTF